MAQWVITSGTTFINLDQVHDLAVTGSGSTWQVVIPNVASLPGVYSTADAAWRAAQRLTNAVEVDTLTD